MSVNSAQASQSLKPRSFQLCAVVGPTASGKSQLADAVAQRLSSEVISVDAMQVYRGMDIGTAKMRADERSAPLQMVDCVDVSSPYSASLFQRDARAHIERLFARGRTPVLCGGTGLYLNCVIDDMHFPAGEITSPARKMYEHYLIEHGADALFQLLKEKDPASVELIHPNNTRRVIRALELLDDGISYASQHKGLHERSAYYTCLIVGLMWPRDVLYERINTRVLRMFEEGFIEEVKRLVPQGLESSTTASQAIGYKEVLDYLHERATYDEMIETIQMRTRRYAKRQLSWFRHDPRVVWLDCTATTHQERMEYISNTLAVKTS